MDRIRRVKCDETKPECRRCTSTGRKCDGYVSFEAFVPSARKPSESAGHRSDGKSLVAPSLRPNNQLAQLETRSLEYFRRRSLYALSGFIETEFWSRFLFQVSESEPAVKHAIIAFSSFHERTEPQYLSLQERSQQTLSPGRQHDFALEQYNRAVRLLRQRLSQDDRSKNVTLTSCILFTCMEFMRGNSDTATTHLRNGLNILRLQPPDNSVDPNTVQGLGLDKSLAPVFARVALVQSLYGQTRHHRFWDLMDVPAEYSPSQFKTLDAARTSLINLMNAVLTFCYMKDYELFESQEATILRQQSIAHKLDEWASAFNNFTHEQAPAQILDHRGVSIVRAHYLLNALWVQKALFCEEEAFDVHIPSFIEIVNILERAIHSPGKPNTDLADLPSFSADMGIVSVLFFTAIKCREPSVRRRASAVLRRGPRREGMWDSIESARVADLIIAVEEEPVRDAPGVLPPEWARIHDFDIQPPDSVYPNQRLVNLRWNPRGFDCDTSAIRQEYIML